jgi:hypothetical protein
MTEVSLATKYAVYKSGRVVASGDLHQCWTYILTVHERTMSAIDLADAGIYIAPINQQRKAS